MRKVMHVLYLLFMVLLGLGNIWKDPTKPCTLDLAISTLSYIEG